MSENSEPRSRWADLPEAKRDLLEKRLRGELPGSAGAGKITPRIDRSLFPMSYAQTRLWFLAQYEQEKSAYNDIRVLRLEGSLNLSALEKSFHQVIRRHEILRSNYTSVKGLPKQTVGLKLEPGISLVDLSYLPQAERNAEMTRQSQEQVRRPFNLAEDLLIRAFLYRLDEDEHALVLIVHNIVCDGISVAVLYKELASFYSAIIGNHAVLLQDLPVQYADFASWQRKWLQGERLEKLITYWRGQMAGIPPSLNLPTDRPRPRIQTYNGKRQMLVLPGKLTSALKDLSHKEDVTLFMTMLAAFKTLLYRYAQQEEIVIGTLISNRNRIELEPLIGFFVNTLVVRTSLAGNPRFIELLGRVRSMALSAYDNQDLPFEKLIEEIRPERDLSRNPLFQVLFTFKNTPLRPFEMGTVRAVPFVIDTGMTHFDLTVEIFDHTEELHCQFEHNTDLYDCETILRMMDHFKILLHGIVDHPNKHLAELPILSPVERNKMLGEWNDTRTDYDREHTIHQLFEEQVKRTPDAVALVFGGEELAFRELNTRANQIAVNLQKLGVGPEVLVGICVERSPELIIGLLGILKAGGAYIPLDPAYPTPRLSFMLKDANPHVLVTNTKFENKFNDFKEKVVCLDKEWFKIKQEKVENPVCEVSLDNLAYVLYTSGSTGKPKGVLGLHKGAVNRFWWMWETYPFESEEICCHKTSLSFVDSVWEIFGPLLQGVRLVLIPDEAVIDPRMLVDLLAKYQISRIVLVPSLLKALLEFDDLHERLPRLQIWTSSGETLPIDLVQRFNKDLPERTLLNLYGSTEVSADAAHYAVKDDDSNSLRMPIGAPIANTQIYLLDRYLKPVPVGVPGSLFVGGDGVARGYINKPTLTSERFLPNPFKPVGDHVIYDTGDFAMFLPDGSIELLGRVDHQVKIRGFRVELGEIETVLSDHPSVQQAVVLADKSTGGDQRLVAYIVKNPGLNLSTDEALHYLQEYLPSYMLPAAYVFLDVLPLTPSGKVDRLALINSGALGLPARKTYLPPADALESQLVSIWERTLELDHIGVDDDFFELGGHSLLAARLFANVEIKTGCRLPLAALFRAPTVSQIANIMREDTGLSWSPLVAVKTEGSKPPLFCVAALGGNVLTYRDLALRLGSDQPVYALQAQGLDGSKQPFNRVEDHAAYYINGILGFQSGGPYYLCGTSYGGLLAYEMGQQLLKKGKSVGLVAMFDTYTPQYAKQFYDSDPEKFRWQVLADRTQLHFSNFMVADWRGKLNYLSVKWPRFQRQLRRKKLQRQSLQKVDLQARLKKVELASRQAIRTYEVEAYLGYVVLFRASNHPPALSQDQTLGWGEVLGENLAIYEVPGHHGSLTYEPRASVLAEMLADILAAI